MTQPIIPQSLAFARSEMAGVIAGYFKDDKETLAEMVVRIEAEGDEITQPIIPQSLAFARLATTHYKMYERVKQKMTQQMGAWDRFEMPVPTDLRAWTDESVAHFDTEMGALLKTVENAWAGTLLDDWRKSQHGLGPALLMCLSLMPSLTEFSSVPKVWAYMGLHAVGSRGEKDKAYSRTLKVWMMFRVAEPCTKATLRLCTCGGDTKRQKKIGDDACTYACQQCGLVLEKDEATVIYTSPYRKVYDERKDRLPDMLKEGEGCEFCDKAYAERRRTGKAGWDCHNMGGPHYKAGHRHIDALRVTAKAVLRDCWTVVHNGGPGGPC